MKIGETVYYTNPYNGLTYAGTIQNVTDPYEDGDLFAEVKGDGVHVSTRIKNLKI